MTLSREKAFLNVLGAAVFSGDVSLVSALIFICVLAPTGLARPLPAAMFLAQKVYPCD